MKNYVLDTTVLLYDADAIFCFGENNVIIPITVVEEIDQFKKEITETGRNAREAARHLDGLRKQGSLAAGGVKLDNGGTLEVRMTVVEPQHWVLHDLGEDDRDTRMLAVALEVKRERREPTIFVTKDIYLRIKADVAGLVVEDYKGERVEIEELYAGYAEQTVDSSLVEALRHGKDVALDMELLPNQYVTLAASDERAYGRYDADAEAVRPLVQACSKINCRVTSRNPEQAFALDALLNDDVELVTLVGKAGTGKTLLAVAASIYKTVDESIFNRILVSRPTLPMGQDIGYLPGTIEQKLTPWMYPIADNVELIMRSETRIRGKVRGFRELVEMGILVIEPLTYIRGRSIHNQYLIVDEAQNLTPHEVKTIITRAGKGTKVVLTGDPYQIDNPYIDSSSNGLTSVVEKFKEQKITAHVVLTRGERSALSELAANLL